MTQKNILEGRLTANTFELFVLHSDGDPDEHRQVFRHAPEGIQHLSTNIAETSLTIDDVVSEILHLASI